MKKLQIVPAIVTTRTLIRSSQIVVEWLKDENAVFHVETNNQ